MNTKTRWLTGIVFGVCVLALLGIIGATLVPGPTVLGSVNDREVVGQAASRRGPARFNSDGNDAELQLGSHTARVTSEHVELANGRKVSIPVSCKKIRLVEASAGLRVFFDGTEQK